MSITLKPINFFQELEPYDVDVDNRPLLDINDNLQEIVNILNASGYYSEIAADPSLEPAGGFSIFSCACVYSNSLLIPIDISKTISELDYSKYPIVLVVNYDADIKKYGCVYFSAGIKLSNKFSSFVPGSEGRLLKVGPGGEMIDQLYYDLANGNKGYQSLYVGKILTTNSIVFGGNQINVSGNNAYLAKNQDDTTSGLITVQRSNSDSPTIFKSVNINNVGSPYTYAEYMNSYGTPGSISLGPVAVYFSSTQLPFNQSSGTFTQPNVELYLNDLHFRTPDITSISTADVVYKTSGVNIRSLLDFHAINATHSSSYSNNAGEVEQTLSTRLSFTDRTKAVLSEPDVAMGVSLPNKTIYVGTVIDPTTNLPNTLMPTSDVTGVILGDYFGTGGAYFGAMQDDTTLSSGRPSAEVDFAANRNTSGVTTTNLITDYSNAFTAILAVKSNTGIPSNLVFSADGYLNLSSGMGILTNSATPKLDLELTAKKYVDTLFQSIAASDANKVPMTGTPSGSNITGSLFIDVAGNTGSNTTAIILNGVNGVDIKSYNPVSFTDATGSFALQIVHARTTDGLTITPGDTELVNKTFLSAYVDNAISGGSTNFVTLDTPQTISGLKTFSEYTTVTVTPITPGTATKAIRLSTPESGAIPADILVDKHGTVTIDSPTAVLLDRETESADPDKALVTNKYFKDAIAALSPDTDVVIATWNDQSGSPASTVAVGGNTYACRFTTASTGAPSFASSAFGSYFQATPNGLHYVGTKPIIVQVNTGNSWGQNVGADQYRTSSHVIHISNGVNYTIASDYSQFDGPSGFSAFTGASVSAVFVVSNGDYIVAGGKLTGDVGGVPPMHQYLSIVKLGLA